jgi:hypothetical protein
MLLDHFLVPRQEPFLPLDLELQALALAQRPARLARGDWREWISAASALAACDDAEGTPQCGAHGHWQRVRVLQQPSIQLSTLDWRQWRERGASHAQYRSS